MSAVSARCAVKVGTDTVTSARSDAGCETRDDKPVCFRLPRSTRLFVLAFHPDAGRNFQNTILLCKLIRVH